MAQATTNSWSEAAAAESAVRCPGADAPSRAATSPTNLDPPGGGRRFRRLRRIGRAAPALLVMLLLAAIAVYGHRADWKLPKFSAIVSGEPGGRDDWCHEHAVPESQCVECNTALLPRGADHGWCKAHGVHNCPLDHIDVAQLKQTPVVVEADRKRLAEAVAVGPRRENNPVCKNYRRRIQFVSHEAVEKAGVDVGVADRQPMVESIVANGRIAYDQTRFASLAPRLPGTVRHVEKNVGQSVQSGDILALIDAAEVGRAKSELIQALVQEELARKALKRLESLAEVVPGRQLQEAQATAAQSRARLLGAKESLGNLGLPVDLDALRGLPEEKRIERLRLLGLSDGSRPPLRLEQATANLLPVKTPLSGLVVARHAAVGEVVDATHVLFQVADTSRVWLSLSVSVEDAGRIAVGQTVRFAPDGASGQVGGKLVWISTAADPQTRMVTVRAELPNPNGRLRNETFGTGKILLREEPEAITVPNEAVHWDGCCHVVFVRDKGYFSSPESPKVFHVRSVRVGAGNGKSTEILAGVLPGEVVAAKGSDVLRAELLKNSLGEGCCAAK